MARRMDIAKKLTEQQWQIVCRLTDIQKLVADTWRDLVTNGEMSYLAQHLDDLEASARTLRSIVRHADRSVSSPARADEEADRG